MNSSHGARRPPSLFFAFSAAIHVAILLFPLAMEAEPIQSPLEIVVEFDQVPTNESPILEDVFAKSRKTLGEFENTAPSSEVVAEPQSVIEQVLESLPEPAIESIREPSREEEVNSQIERPQEVSIEPRSAPAVQEAFAVLTEPSVNSSPAGSAAVTPEVSSGSSTILSGAPSSAAPSAPFSPLSSSSSTSKKSTESDYGALVRNRIEARKKYPPLLRQLGVEGTVEVEFLIGSDGTISKLTALKWSESALKNPGLKAIREAAPFPPPPDGRPVVFRIKLVYELLW